jgi:hypothetical protein
MMSRGMAAVAIGFVLAATSQPTFANTPEQMMAQCRNRAHDALRVRLPDIDAKYEGQRTDGTHAVNGTAQVRGNAETFQCSFDKAGSRIIRFVVNRADAPPAQAPGAKIETRRVQFARGTSAATVQGRITGDQTVDYLLGARAGQNMNVSMTSPNAAAYFNILAPGENEVAMFNGSVNGNQFEGVLPRDGDYRIRVYLMRSAARRNEAASFRFEMIVAANAGASGGQAGGGSGGDALVPGTNYHATGAVPCTMGGGQPTGQCPFGVTREGPGKGIVTITKPDGRKRAVFFEGGQAVGYDQSQADPGEFHATRRGDLSIIGIGQERYEIPDAVISGG